MFFQPGMAAFSSVSEEQEFQRNLELLDLVTLGQVRRRSGQATSWEKDPKKPFGNSTEQLKHLEHVMLVVPCGFQPPGTPPRACEQFEDSHGMTIRRVSL